MVNILTDFLSAYPSILGPVTGILICDYWIVRRQQFDIRHLYARKGGKFWFFHGLNWRAFAAFLCAYVPNLPGFIHQVQPSIRDAQPYTYALNWIFSVLVSVITFWVFNRIAPPRYSLSGGAVDADDVIDWEARVRVGDWSDVPGFETACIEGMSQDGDTEVLSKVAAEGAARTTVRDVQSGSASDTMEKMA